MTVWRYGGSVAATACAALLAGTAPLRAQAPETAPSRVQVEEGAPGAAPAALSTRAPGGFEESAGPSGLSVRALRPLRPVPVHVIPVHVAAPGSGDVREEVPFFTARDARIAAGFLAGALAMVPVDRALADALQDPALQAHGVLGGAAGTMRFVGFPGTLIIGSSLYVAGRMADLPRVAAIGLHGSEAVVLASGVVGAGKLVLGRARPRQNPGDPFDLGFPRGLRDDEYRSFPSGHTAAAFALAAAVTAETREIWPEGTTWVGPLLFTGATLVGVSRMYHNRHWASDVVIGAGIGTFSGLKVIRYHYRYPDNRLDRLLLAARVTAGPDGVVVGWTLPLPRGN
jgi:membrane-associated phospholipid phosphatase